MKTVVCYLIDRIKSVGGHTTGLIVLEWNVGKLHTKTLGLGNNNFRWWVGMVVLKTVLIRIIWFLMTLHCFPSIRLSIDLLCNNANKINFQCHFRMFLAAPHLQFLASFKNKKNGEVHTRSPAKYKIKS